MKDGTLRTALIAGALAALPLLFPLVHARIRDRHARKPRRARRTTSRRRVGRHGHRRSPRRAQRWAQARRQNAADSMD
jgi:hypothetical protein